MGSANERRRYNVTASLIGWVHNQNDPCGVHADHGNQYIWMLRLLYEFVYCHCQSWFDRVMFYRRYKWYIPGIYGSSIMLCRWSCSQIKVHDDYLGFGSRWPRLLYIDISCDLVTHMYVPLVSIMCILAHGLNVTYVSVNRVIIGSGNGLALNRCQAITWTEDNELSVRSQWTNQ